MSKLVPRGVGRKPPAEVTLTYRRVGTAHVFTAVECRGLHISSASLEDAFNAAIQGLGEHMSHLYEVEVAYAAGVTYDEFEASLGGERAISGKFLTVKRMESCVHAYA